MSYNSTTKIVSKTVVNGVTYGVSFRDVQQALGVTDTDEHALCQSDKVRMLSRYKPIVDTLRGQTRKREALSNNDFMIRDWGFRIPTFQGTALESKAKAIVDGGAVWNTYQQGAEPAGIGNGWVYPAPVRNVNFARISDFDGYDGSKPYKYSDKTFVVSESMRIISKADGDFTPVFTFRLNPYCPRNFKTLEGYCLGVAFWYRPESGNDSGVYFYIEDNSTGMTLSATSQADMELRIPKSYITALLNKTVNRTSNRVNRATFYAVGFFAPNDYHGMENLSGDAAASHLADLIPVPGLGFDSFQWQYVSGSGDFDVCLLAIEGVATSVPAVGSKGGIPCKILSVTNNYDLIKTDPDGYIHFYPAYLMYTFDVYNDSGQKVTALSQSTRSYFGNNSGDIDVSNTVRTGEGSSAVVTHKTTDVSGNNITCIIPAMTTAGAVEGYRVVVHLWYITFNSTTSSQEYRDVGQFAVAISGELPRDI